MTYRGERHVVHSGQFWDALEHLVRRFAGSLPPPDRSLMLEMWREEEGLAVDVLAAALVEDQILVTTDERELLRVVLNGFDLADVEREHYPMLHQRGTVLARLRVSG